MAGSGCGLPASVNDTGVGQDGQDSTGSDQGRVLDRDLQIVVNGLWAAGAEAIAINGERLTSLSAIRSAGQAILVDYRPLVPPYVIEAIGDPTRLQAGFADDIAGPYVQSLEDNYGVRVNVADETAMTLPGAGALDLRSAHPPVATAAPGHQGPGSTRPPTPEVSP